MTHRIWFMGYALLTAYQFHRVISNLHFWDSRIPQWFLKTTSCMLIT